MLPGNVLVGYFKFLGVKVVVRKISKVFYTVMVFLSNLYIFVPTENKSETCHAQKK